MRKDKPRLLRKPLPYGRRILPPMPGFWIAAGPGIVWMAAAQGSGELIWWPYLIAKYGLPFLCLLIPACLLQYPLTFEIGRYSAFSAESVWKGLQRVSPIMTLVLWICFLTSFIWIGAWASAAGTALAELTQFPAHFGARGRSLTWGVLCVLFFSAMLITRRKPYGFIQGLMWFVAGGTLVGLVVSILNPQVMGHIPAFLKAVVIPPLTLSRPWDPSDAERLIAAITYAGMGGFWMLFYSYWVLGKGIAGSAEKENASTLPDASRKDAAENAAQWRRFIAADAGVGIGGNIVTTMMTCLLAYALLNPAGLIPEGWRIAVEQARFFEISWGLAGRCIFLFVAACFLADTWPSSVDVIARTGVDLLRPIIPSLSRISEVSLYRLAVFCLTIISLITIFLEQPGELIVFTAVVNFLCTPVLIIAVILLIHGPFKKSLPPALRPGRLSLNLMLFSLLVYSGLTGAYLYICWVR